MEDHGWPLRLTEVQGEVVFEPDAPKSWLALSLSLLWSCSTGGICAFSCSTVAGGCDTFILTAAVASGSRDSRVGLHNGGAEHSLGKGERRESEGRVSIHVAAYH